VTTLVSISGTGDAGTLAVHTINALPVLVIFPHNRCNCRCVMCDIWRSRETQQLMPADLERHLVSFRELAVRWVVLSGGEPQLNEQWSYLAQLFRSVGSRVTLLTAGLLLKHQARQVVDSVDDVIVSLDGPPATHNHVRRVADAFERLADGVGTLHGLNPHIPVRARCTVQKANCCSLRATVRSAKKLGLSSVSFLAADLTSTAFNRPEGWLPDRANHVALNNEEVEALQAEVHRLISEHALDLESGYIVESAAKLNRMVAHFRAHLGQGKDVAPHCNAPWVSAVIEASGDLRPCFFHPVIGNIHRRSLADIVNSQEALRFRSHLDVANNETCKRCVCSLYMNPDHRAEEQ
jgi:Fe-coproporphyrin III synthase